MEHLPGCAFDGNRPHESAGSCVPDCPIGGAGTRDRLAEEIARLEASIARMDAADCDEVDPEVYRQALAQLVKVREAYGRAVPR
jgi:hypothetical protein